MAGDDETPGSACAMTVPTTNPVPSPQLIVAVKLAGSGLTLAEVNDAMFKVEGFPACTVTGIGVTVINWATATCATLLAPAR